MNEAFLTDTANGPLVSVRLTDKGRELLTKGLFEQDTFDIVKFSFGDSEIDYSLGDDAVSGYSISAPDVSQLDFNSKLYASGTVPAGDPYVVLDATEVVISENQAIDVVVQSYWPPVEGKYLETYKWVNLGPLTDYEFSILTSNNTRNATIVSYDVTGSTRIKVVGQLTGRYAFLDVTIG